jgi:hypothetical protein
MSKTKTKTEAINWIATPRDDWDGVELIDPVTGDVHVAISMATPEALALIKVAPKLLAALKQIAEDDIGAARRQPIAKTAIKQAEEL